MVPGPWVVRSSGATVVPQLPAERGDELVEVGVQQVVVHLDVVLDRAAAFAHIVGVGRGQLDDADAHSGARLLDMALHLRRAAALERSGSLH